MIGPDIVEDPTAHPLHHLRLVDVSRNNQIRQFEMDSLLMHGFQGVKHRLQPPAVQFAVNLVINGLQVDVGRIKDRLKKIFDQANETGRPTHELADELARSIVAAARQ